MIDTQKTLKILAVNLGSCLALLLALELALRYAEAHGSPSIIAPGFPWLAYDLKNDMWRNWDSGDDYPFDIDELGNRVVPVASKQDSIRVACIGDSTVFGCWKDGNNIRFDNFPEELAIAMRNQVVNLGTVGHSTREGVIRMAEVPKDVDVVFARFGWNDHARKRTVHGPSLAILRRILPIRVEPGPLEPNVNETELRNNVRAIHRIAKERNQRLIWLDYPIRITEHNQKLPLMMHEGLAKSREDIEVTHKKYLSIIEETCREEGVTFLPTQMDETGFSPDDCVHPNDVGSKYLGKFLAQFLQ